MRNSVILIAAAILFVVSQFYAGVERTNTINTQEQITKLSLSNCTDLKELTDGVYKLAVTLDGLAEVLESQLKLKNPDAEIIIHVDEPKAIECRPNKIVPTER